MRTEYFPNIQGMRALAVLAVAIFHAFPAMLPGGYIGVDVFFVISGYLISGILFRELSAGEFSIGRFYARRIRRIFPALALVLAACLGFGYFALLPQELGQLGSHTAGGAGFMSNLVLWRETGYFDNSAEAKPLLHLWSLGVEEQFYIAWPLLVYLAWQGRRWFVPVMLLLAAGSFAYNIAHLHSSPVASFYSPLSRFWELAAGGLLAYRQFAASEHAPEGVKPYFSLRSIVGLAAVVAAACLLNKESAFPGYWALLPVAGAVLLIAAGPRAMFNRSLLSHPVAVWIGSVSYPFYLWHWPLLAFAYILQSGKPTPEVRAAALGVSLALAWLTNALLENRIRFATLRMVPFALAGAMLLVGGAGFGVHLSGGLPQREVADLGKYLPSPAADKVAAAPQPTEASAEAQRAPVTLASITDTPESASALLKLKDRQKNDVASLYELWMDKYRQIRSRTCHIDETQDTESMTFENYLAGNASCVVLHPEMRNVLVIGDSTAAEMYVALSRAYPEINFVQVTGSACKPFLGAYAESGHRCAKLVAYAFQLAQQNKFDAVVVASAWTDDYTAAQPDLQRLVALGRPVLLVGPPLQFSEEVMKTMLRMSGRDSLAAKLGMMIQQDSLDRADAMSGFAARNKVTYLNRAQLFCEDGCPVITRRGDPLILDKFHLSLPGIDLLGSRIKAHQTLESLLGKS